VYHLHVSFFRLSEIDFIRERRKLRSKKLNGVEIKSTSFAGKEDEMCHSVGGRERRNCIDHSLTI
jgi:hypothetical protein